MQSEIILGYLNGTYKVDEIDFCESVITIDLPKNMTLNLLIHSKSCLVYSFSGVNFLQLTGEESSSILVALTEVARKQGDKRWLKWIQSL